MNDIVESVIGRLDIEDGIGSFPDEFVVESEYLIKGGVIEPKLIVLVFGSEFWGFVDVRGDSGLGCVFFHERNNYREMSQGLICRLAALSKKVLSDQNLLVRDISQYADWLCLKLNRVDVYNTKYSPYSLREKWPIQASIILLKLKRPFLRT